MKAKSQDVPLQVDEQVTVSDKLSPYYLKQGTIHSLDPEAGMANVSIPTLGVPTFCYDQLTKGDIQKPKKVKVKNNFGADAEVIVTNPESQFHNMVGLIATGIINNDGNYLVAFEKPTGQQHVHANDMDLYEPEEKTGLGLANGFSQKTDYLGDPRPLARVLANGSQGEELALAAGHVELNRIVIGPHNPRKYFDEAAMQELVESIRVQGVLQPILLRPLSMGIYELVCGERRYRACLAVQVAIQSRDKIPAYVREMSDEEALQAQISENLQRKDVHPMEEAAAIKAMLERYSDEEVAAKLGKKVYYIRQRLQLNNLSDSWQQIFYQNAIPVSIALKLAQAPDKQQAELLRHKVGNTPLANVKQLSIDHYDFRNVNDLTDAPFDITDPTLNKAMGPCTTCPFNTAVQALFPEAAELPRCTNSECWKIKTDNNFQRQVKLAKQQLAAGDDILLLNTGHYSYGNDKVVEQFKKDGNTVYLAGSWKEQPQPVPPSLAALRDEYEDDLASGDMTEDELSQTLLDAQQEYEKDKAAYDKAVASGKCKKGLIIAGTQSRKGKWILVNLSKANSPAAAEKKEKPEPGSMNIGELKSEIKRITDLEQRKQQLDRVKVHKRIYDEIDKNDELRYNGAPLASVELIGICVTLFPHLTDKDQKHFRKELGLSSSYTHHRRDIAVALDELFDSNTSQAYKLTAGICRAGLLNKLKSHNEPDHTKDGEDYAHLLMADAYMPGFVSIAQTESADAAAKRTKRAGDRVDELKVRLKEKEGKAADKAAKKSAAKTGTDAKGAVKGE